MCTLDSIAFNTIRISSLAYKLTSKLQNQSKISCPVSVPTCETQTHQCLICWENFSDSVRLNCSGFHTFCTSCILQWFRMSGKSECPVCRSWVTALLQGEQCVSIPSSRKEGSTSITTPVPKKRTSARTASPEQCVGNVDKLLKTMTPEEVSAIPVVSRLLTSKSRQVKRTLLMRHTNRYVSCVNMGLCN